jgi:serine/threonine protein kinase/tetratricopeptide (TPR) repeat protein
MDTPQQVGPYKILETLGEGGMGIVYAAEQRGAIRRRVALKVIKLGMDTKDVLARFEAERQALALLDHVHIAKVFEAGATNEGRPYFTMELVRGVPIHRYCDMQKSTIRERLNLMLQACAALQHAHERGILHRDIKPSNILVAEVEGKGHVKVIDFGMAKATNQRLTERTLFTEEGRIIGTPEYMSPEQADLSSLDVDQRTDVYSLGVVLYELLAGALPFDSKLLRSSGYLELQRIIREEEPPTPSKRITGARDCVAQIADLRSCRLQDLASSLKKGLDAVVMKAIAKRRGERYSSCADLAADLERFLAGEPVQARRLGIARGLQAALRRVHRRNAWLLPTVATASLMLVLMLDKRADLSSSLAGAGLHVGVGPVLASEDSLAWKHKLEQLEALPPSYRDSDSYKMDLAYILSRMAFQEQGESRGRLLLLADKSLAQASQTAQVLQSRIWLHGESFRLDMNRSDPRDRSDAVKYRQDALGFAEQLQLMQPGEEARARVGRLCIMTAEAHIEFANWNEAAVAYGKAIIHGGLPDWHVVIRELANAMGGRVPSVRSLKRMESVMNRRVHAALCFRVADLARPNQRLDFVRYGVQLLQAESDGDPPGFETRIEGRHMFKAGMLLVVGQEHELARYLFSIAAEPIMDPEVRSLALMQRSRIFSENGRLDEALADCRAADQAGVGVLGARDLAWIRGRQSTLARTLGRPEDALSAMRKASDLLAQPKHKIRALDAMWIQTELGRLLFEAGSFDEALLQLEKALVLADSVPESGGLVARRAAAQMYLGLAFLALGRRSEAESQLSNVLAIVGDPPRADCRDFFERSAEALQKMRSSK